MDYMTLIFSVAKNIKVSGALLLAVCTHESGLKNVSVLSDGGSPTYGICQVKLATAQMIGYKGTAKGLMDPKTNITLAAQYLKFQYDRYDQNWCKTVAAYNAGRYNESKVVPGKPRNLKYVRKVQKKLVAGLRYKLSCNNNLEK